MIPSAPVVKRKLPRWLIAVMGSLAALAVLAVIVGAFFLYNAHAREIAEEAWAAVTMPAELSSALFASAAPGKSVLYERGFLGFRERYPLDGMRISIVRSDDHVASIARTSDRSPLSLELDGKEMTKISPAATGLAVSPNGTRFAFQVPSLVGSSTKSWDISFFDTETSAARMVAEGQAPFFIDDERVGIIGADGISSLAFADSTASTTELVPLDSSELIQDVALSPDRTLVGWYDPTAKEIRVYRITDTVMTPVVSVRSTVRSLALSNDRLYLLAPLPDGSKDVWSYTLDDGAGTRIHHLPASLNIYRMIF